jgi:uncharacterized protein involved in exopolysaccharide biosynthesis
MSAMPRGAEGVTAIPEIHRREIPLGEPPRSDGISGVGIINVLLRYRVLVLTMGLVVAFLAGLGSIRSPRGYTVDATFMPKGARGSSQLGGLAAQFGVNLGGDAANSPQLYADLLKNRTLLWPVALRQYSIKTKWGIRSGNIIEIYNLKHPRPEVVRIRAVESIKRSIKTGVTKTGTIVVNVTTGYPELSLQIMNYLLEQVNIYNLGNRQKDAAAQREFVERQVAEKQSELRQAEDELKTFLERNRQYRTSPELSLEENRLERQVSMRQTIYTGLLSSYESARIEEVKDLPVITIIEQPEMPVEPNPRGTVKKTILGFIVGMLLGCLIAFPADRIARKREAQTDDFIEFAALKRAAIGDLTHPWRPVQRVIQSRRKA